MSNSLRILAYIPNFIHIGPEEPKCMCMQQRGEVEEYEQVWLAVLLLLRVQKE